MQNILLCHCFLGHCLHTKHTSPSLKLPSFVGMASALKGSVVGKVVETVKVRLLSVSVDFIYGVSVFSLVNICPVHPTTSFWVVVIDCIALVLSMARLDSCLLSSNSLP